MLLLLRIIHNTSLMTLPVWSGCRQRTFLLRRELRVTVHSGKAFTQCVNPTQLYLMATLRCLRIQTSMVRCANGEESMLTIRIRIRYDIVNLYTLTGGNVYAVNVIITRIRCLS